MAVVERDDPFDEVEFGAGVGGDADHGGGVLGEAGSAPAGAGFEEAAADAGVIAHAQHDVVDVGADLFAEVGHLVDEGQLGGQEGVGGVLDEFGRDGVADDDGGGEFGVEARHLDGGVVVGAADDDPVGVQEVMDRGAFAEELGVRDDCDVVAPDDVVDHRGGADRDRGLVDDDRPGRQDGADLGGGRFEIGQVGRAVGTRRGGDAEVVVVGAG